MSTETLANYYNLITAGAIKDGSRLDVMLSEKNPMPRDMAVFAANEKMGHTGTRVTSLATGAFRKVSGFKTPGTSTFTPYHDDISIFYGQSVVPDDVKRLEGAAKVALIESTHEEGYWQGIARHIIEGDSATTPEKYDGLGVRYNTPDDGSGSYDATNPDPSTAAQVNVLSAGGTGNDTMSIWFMRHGEGQIGLITPMNDPQYGLTMKDKGLMEESDATSATNPQGTRDIWKKEWEWWHGLSVGNHKCVGRIRNIESSLDSIDSSLKRLIYQMFEELMTEGTGTIWMYCPRRMMTHFQILLEAKMNVIFSADNPYGVAMNMWAGKSPIQSCDSLSITETAVTPV